MNSKGYGFRRWKILNEPQRHNLNSKSYLAHIKNIGAAIRSVAPNDLIGMHGYWSTEWGEKLLTNGVGFYDFSIMHNYSFKNAYSTNFENIVITDNCYSLGIIAKYNEIMKRPNPNAVQYDTEWELHMGTNAYTGADYNVTNGNIIGTMHRAVRLIY